VKKGARKDARRKDFPEIDLTVVTARFSPLNWKLRQKD
jgi:hypothetical protein